MEAVLSSRSAAAPRWDAPASAAPRARRAARPRKHVRAAAAAVAYERREEPYSIPRGPKETVDQAAAACKRALEAGITRQRVQMLLPLIGATDLDDWPGGIRQQFKAASPMVEDLLRALRQLPGLSGSLRGAVLDDGDAVASWTGERLAAVLFPTAETLRDVRGIAEERGAEGRVVLLVNPQWNESEGANVVSDFGILPWVVKASKELVGSFTTVYELKSMRINGDELRVLYSYPHGWQVNAILPDNPSTTECILQQAERPSYGELEKLLRSLPWTISSKPLGERLQYEAAMMRSTMRPPRDQEFRE